MTVPQPARAADATPTKVEVTSVSDNIANGGVWNVTVDYSDGTTRTLRANGSVNSIIVFYLAPGHGVTYEMLKPSANGMVALSDDSAPGVLLGVTNIGSASYGNDTLMLANAYATSTDCTVDSSSNLCLTAGLAVKPQTQAATVAAVPTTGAPSSDLVMPAALLAAGMVGGGLLIRRKKDRGRA